MNKLVIIGNGFDLAHGLKTSYNDFMLWYLKKCLTRGWHSDLLMEVALKDLSLQYTYNHVTTIDELVDWCYQSDQMDNLFDGSSISGVRYNFTGVTKELINIFTIRFKSELATNLLLKCRVTTWVEIENEFYQQLKRVLNDSSDKRLQLLTDLNASLKVIIDELQLYLSSLPEANLLRGYGNMLKSLFTPLDVKAAASDPSIKRDQVLLLNFNYTPTVEGYIQGLPYEFQQEIDINYIHGKINDDSNPVVFGFGDELDSDYQRMELEKTNAFFEYIKSFWYFKTSNYQNLIRFLEADTFEVHVWGHSCGLSDRTLLNMIFEHEQCASIKIYYYQKDGWNNHKHLTQEIARHLSQILQLNKICQKVGN